MCGCVCVRVCVRVRMCVRMCDEEKRKKKVVKEATRKKWVEKFPWIEWTGCMVLNQLHKKVSQIEIGRLED